MDPKTFLKVPLVSIFTDLSLFFVNIFQKSLKTHFLASFFNLLPAPQNMLGQNRQGLFSVVGELAKSV